MEESRETLAVDGWDMFHDCKNVDEVMWYMQIHGLSGSANAEIGLLWVTSR